MLPTHERNRDTDKNLKTRDQGKNRLKSNSQVETTSRNAGKGNNWHL